ncbi:MAG: phenylalanine--tRNA ligase subunit beta [Candidatus Pacebacteria bacterium]|nr:phenylalanine--tRNA ligase subunit beta [Candidatus Paceibacterota bacterium]
MLFSRHWLQTFFESTLPSAEVIGEKLTFHSSEIEEVVAVGEDTVFDIKILPDKSAWLLSHRGVAKELAVMLDLEIKNDPLATDVESLTQTDAVQVASTTPTCDYYSVVRISGVKVGESPAWLKTALEAIGQRSINNIVDATNYVMFNLGQPLHAFDAGKLTAKDGVHNITVRSAKDSEAFTSLTGEEYVLTTDDAVITDGHNDTVLALAGVKGGVGSGVDKSTTDIILESAHFDRVATRLTSKRHKLQTDASKRYENGIDRTLAQYGLVAGANLIAQVAGGEVVGMRSVGGGEITKRAPVSVSLTRINSVLGLTLTQAEVEAIIKRFGYEYTLANEMLEVTPPFERDDLVIAEDVIEEIGRMYGLGHIVSIAPTPIPVAEYNARHYYAQMIREALVGIVFSEVYTSTFRANDVVKIENALASDKGYLRSTLVENIKEAGERNIGHRDLLGLSAVKIFEIGTVFNSESEEFRVCLLIQSGTSYKAKQDEPLVAEALATLTDALGVTPVLLTNENGVVEFSLDALLPQLPAVTTYEVVESSEAIRYQPFSVYPSVSRDIAMWVEEGVEVGTVEAALRAAAGPLLARLTHLDTFTKDGRTSLAFRLVFQSNQKTLDGAEVDKLMQAVYSDVAKAGWEAR